MQERQGRLFFALFISLGLWLGLQYFFQPPEENKSKDKITKESNQEETEEPTTTPTPESSKPETSLTDKPSLSEKDMPQPVDPSRIQTYFLATDPYLIELTSLGGRIKSFYIKNHPETDGSELQILKDPDKHQVEFNGETYTAVEISRKNGFDFNPIFDKDKIPQSYFNYVNFTPKVDEEKFIYSFESLSADKSYTLIKTYQFFPTENYFTFRLDIKNNTNQDLVVASPKNPLFFRSYGSLGPIDSKPSELNDREMANYFRYYNLDGSFNDYIDGTSTEGFFSNMFGGSKSPDPRFEIKKANSGEAVDFVGSGSRYFIAVMDPLGYNPEGLLMDNRTGNQTGVLLVYDNIKIPAGGSESFDYASYVGVREKTELAFRNKDLDPILNQKSPFKGLSENLVDSTNQGLTTPFRNGIVWILKKIYIVVPNYGWAIIIFAILFKLVFFPLNQKQADSMKKMQELSPQIKEINEKYADDPQVKQTKIMELYKKNKVNPMGGCLPMLIQIPIFIALYTAFSDTVELWESPFLWVKDLSQPDTVFVFPPIMGVQMDLNLLPLIMVSSQVLQSRLTIVSSDPNQKMMMYMMPLIMLYFFWGMPAGVTLYWTMTNILSIVQQLLTNRFGKDAKLKKMNAENSGNSGGTSGLAGKNAKSGPAGSPQPTAKRSAPRKRRKK